MSEKPTGQGVPGRGGPGGGGVGPSYGPAENALPPRTRQQAARPPHLAGYVPSPVPRSPRKNRLRREERARLSRQDLPGRRTSRVSPVPRLRLGTPGEPVPRPAV